MHKNIKILTNNYLKNLVVVFVYGLTFSSGQVFGQRLNNRILDTEVKISGTFGEFRGNHFHAGIDYKTEKKEGIPIFAADDGYVFRILVSRSGYGKALYINHKGGLTTVYAHLRDFDGEIADSVWRIQKKQRHFELDYRPGHQKIKVKKGQLIGYSGNTGSSEGPHLHFETRDTESEKPFDPVSVGFGFEDEIAPNLEYLWIYPATSDTPTYPLPNPKQYNGQTKDTIEVNEPFMIGISAYDLAGNEKNRLGIKTANLFLNGKLKLSFSINPFEFSQTKEITGMIDQGLRAKGKESFLLHAAPALTIPFFEKNHTNGIFHLADQSINQINIVLEDAADNKNTFTFHFKKIPSVPMVESSEPHCNYLSPGIDTILQVDGFKGHIDASSLLGPSCIQLEKIVGENNITPTFIMGSIAIPLMKPVKIHFKLDSATRKLVEKALVVRIDKSKKTVPLFGKIKDGWIIAESGSLGSFQLMTDHEAPECKNPTYFEDDLTKRRALALELEDNLSGVGEFRCKVDGKWIYSEYYPSRKILIIYNIDSHLGKELEIKATDRYQNTSRTRFLIEP